MKRVLLSKSLKEMAQLIQMENHTTFLLSQLLKGQSIENSNENLKRKEEIVQFEKENLGVHRFMSMVDAKTLRCKTMDLVITAVKI